MERPPNRSLPLSLGQGSRESGPQSRREAQVTIEARVSEEAYGVLNPSRYPHNPSPFHCGGASRNAGLCLTQSARRGSSRPLGGLCGFLGSWLPVPSQPLWPLGVLYCNASVFASFVTSAVVSSRLSHPLSSSNIAQGCWSAMAGFIPSCTSHRRNDVHQHNTDPDRWRSVRSWGRPYLRLVHASPLMAHAQRRRDCSANCKQNPMGARCGGVHPFLPWFSRCCCPHRLVASISSSLCIRLALGARPFLGNVAGVQHHRSACDERCGLGHTALASLALD